MQTYRFIEAVVLSCKNQEQLQSCISWVNSIEIPDFMLQEIRDLIRAKAIQLMH